MVTNGVKTKWRTDKMAPKQMKKQNDEKNHWSLTRWSVNKIKTKQNGINQND